MPFLVALRNIKMLVTPNSDHFRLQIKISVVLTNIKFMRECFLVVLCQTCYHKSEAP